MTASSRLSAGLLLAALTATWVVAGRSVPAAPAGPAAPPLTVSAPYTHDNLTVYVVRGPDEFDAGNLLTLQEALDRGLAVVHETGTVNQLAVENLSDDRELFLQSGDIVKGGRQDRLIASDLVLPPKSGKVACPANCCEHNRWTGRGAEAAHRFEASTDFAVGNPIKIANATRSQGEVWANVEKAQQQLSEKVGKAVNAAASPTSLQLALEDKDLRARLAGYEAALAGVAGYRDAVGVVVAVNGKVIAADVYGSAKLFKRVWPKLLKAAAADALAQLPKGELPPTPNTTDAETFLASAAGQTADRPARPAPRGEGEQQVVPVGMNDHELPTQALQSPVYMNRLFAPRPLPTPAPDPADQAAVTAIIAGSSERFHPSDLEANAARNLDGTAAGPGGMPNDQFGRNVVTGLGGVARVSNLHVRSGANPVNDLANTPAPAASASPAGIVVVESQAPANPGVTVHRSYLKK